MRAFYGTVERVLALKFHAAELVGTPFAGHAMSPGVGIDCVHVNAWCYLKTRFLESFDPPAYALDEGQHAKESTLLKWLNGNAQFELLKIPFVGIQAGDTLCFNESRCQFHTGLALSENEFVHVPFRGKVTVSDLTQWRFHRGLKSVYRPIES